MKIYSKGLLELGAARTAVCIEAFVLCPVTSEISDFDSLMSHCSIPSVALVRFMPNVAPHGRKVRNSCCSGASSFHVSYEEFSNRPPT